MFVRNSDERTDEPQEHIHRHCFDIQKQNIAQIKRPIHTPSENGNTQNSIISAVSCQNLNGFGKTIIIFTDMIKLLLHNCNVF